MTNYTIPTILIATVLVAGMFAFMPIEKATTVHTTIQGTQLTQVESFPEVDFVDAAARTCDSDADFIVYVVPTAPGAGDSLSITNAGTAFIYEVEDIGGAIGTLTTGSDAGDTVIIGGGTDIDVEGHVTLVTQSGASSDCVAN